MFKSTKDFDTAMYNILVNIREGKTNQENFGLEIDEADFNDALLRIVNLRLVLGVTCTETLGGLSISVFNPRPSYEGLAFIERYEGR